MLLNKIVNAFHLFVSQVKYKTCMKSFGRRSRIISPMLIANPQYIEVGQRVLIRNGLRLEVVDPQNEVVISIGDNVNIEQNCHIIGRVKVAIGNNVTITGNCSIVDVSHPFENIHDTKKIGDRISSIQQPVTIGDGSFIGFGSHISPGVTIGKNCVVGAGSVVTKSIPDYSVVAGVPAKVIKYYSFEENKWVSARS
ncbi:acyltransferase [Enterobacter sp. 120016]|jgi:acetyltransferase-like isoleucine patch superfamily enzyme|uniref:acyltransferase n=1 Tax=Enterobacter sp. 120016 TaxID=2834878 RepID=UPI001BCCE395|nr:acyltransferase [Enterobacter sp. 120016]MBS7441485.1 acyltransferase [Enterobacter sp. 120016]